MRQRHHEGIQRGKSRRSRTEHRRRAAAVEGLEGRRLLAVDLVPFSFPAINMNNPGMNPPTSWFVDNSNGTTGGPQGDNTTLAEGFGVLNAGNVAANSSRFAFNHGHTLFVDSRPFVAGNTVGVNANSPVHSTVVADGLPLWDPDTLDPNTADPLSRLEVTVQLDALDGQATLRTLASFHNPAPSSVTFDAAWVYNMGGPDAGFNVPSTSSGDPTFDAQDRWVVTENFTTNTGTFLNRPVVTAALAGPDHPAVTPYLQTTQGFLAGNGGQDGRLGMLTRFSLTVPAGQTRSLMFFTQMNNGTENAIAAAAAFDATPALDSPLLARLELDQLKTIVNWRLPFNTAPVAADDAFTLDEDTPRTGSILANDTDADGDALSALLDSAPAHGGLTFNSDGTFTYTPAPDYHGPDGFTYHANDGTADSNSAAVSFDVRSVNDAPTIAADAASVAGDEGATLTATGTFGDVDGDAVSLAASKGMIVDTGGGTWSWSYAAEDDESGQVVVTATDAAGASASTSFGLKVSNVAPAVAAGDDAMIVEGGSFNGLAAFTDPGADTWNVTIDYGDNTPGQAFTTAGKSFPLQHTYADDGTYAVSVTVSDGKAAAADTLLVAVRNAAPQVTITSPQAGYLVAAGAPVSFAGTFTDAGVLDSHPGAFWTATNTAVGAVPIAFDGTVNESAGSVTGSRAFTEPGVYRIRLAVSDDDGASGTADTVDGLAATIVVYDAGAGHVTGGGWIESPAGAYPSNPAAVGKASLAFVAKSQGGVAAPTGNLDFRLKSAGLTFKSTGYDQLVVSGSKARVTGSGTLNGVAGYRFAITVIDGREAGGPDRFRIQVWSPGGGVVYDNQPGASNDADPTTAIGGGSIVIHR